MRRGLTLLVLSACYRGDVATTPIAGRPMETMTCSSDDDLKRPVMDTGDGRLRSHSRGPMSNRRRRPNAWVGPEVPRWVAKKVDTLELVLLDPVDNGYLALYRDPYDTGNNQGGSCRMGSNLNCAYEARHYRDGRLAWSLRLNDVLSRNDSLEVQDIRLSGGVLYFNEACQTYSVDASGECSSLVAVDPLAGRVLWRTESLVSNNRFAVRGCYIVAGYGFTNEPDAVHLVERGTGRVVQKVPVETAPQGYKLVGPQQVDVTLYTGAVRRYRLDNVMAPGGKLVALDPDSEFGGANYGGGTYGGGTYGGGAYGGP